MSQFVQFILHHWVLSSFFILLLILVIIEEARAQGYGRFGLTPQKLVQMINQENVSILDIRSINTFKDGHIVGSFNIPQEALFENMNKIQKYKQQPLVLVCVNGQKVSTVAAKLKKLGFEKIQILTGGIAAWKNAGMPLVQD